MFTRRRAPVVTGTEQAKVIREGHAGPDFDARIALCEEAVNVEAVHHLAHYNYGTPDFGIDVLDHFDLADCPTLIDVPRRRRDVGYLGRQLHYMMRDIDASLEKCDSGRLIRAVFHVEAGALLFYEIRPGEYLVGLVLGASSVLAADMAMARAVGKMRKGLSLPDQNPGGFFALYSGTENVPPIDGSSVTTLSSKAANAADNVFLDVASAELHRGSLHYAARFEKSALTSSVDTFEDASLNEYFTRITRRRRRMVYQELGGHFHTLSGSVDRALYGVVGHRTQRTVLDVEGGALYVEHRSREEHILAVTLVQKWVHTADGRFIELVRRYSEATTRG
jgi:hypothetical protein